MKEPVIVIGDGVNELVAANSLARARYDVVLLNRRAAAAEDPFEAGWVPPKFIREFDLERYGFRIHRPDPWAIVWPEERELVLTADIRRSAEAIGNLSARDAEKWPQFCARMHALAGLLQGLYSAPPADPMLGSAKALARIAMRVRGLGRQGMHDLFRLLPMSAADLLDEWFESDALKGVLAGGAVMHLAQGPRSGGTAFNMLHHHVGSPAGVFRPPLSNMRAALARRTQVEVQDGSVARIEVRQGRVAAVVMTDGRELAACAVVSGLSPQRTLLELADPGLLDPELVRAIRNIRTRAVSAQLLLTFDRDPRFTNLVIAPSLDYLERAYDHFKYGGVSPEPYIEATALGSSGNERYHVQVHVQYVPRRQRDAAWDTQESEKLGRNIVARLSDFAPGLARWVINQTVLTPADFEHIHGFPDGQPYHAELALDQWLWMRPVPALAHYRTPIEGLYLCGPAMHPGGGIAGLAGAHAAAVIHRDLKSR
ncbi:MAG TPA: NAD(P)/FAD-dependent oxidoreductase [Burkholderiales bacterium]|nr:NAD(P)/FAD-dependent oxidoreductase [Burkholderiales bacterium]